MRSFRSFWSRDVVADRVDAVVAGLEVSLDGKLSGIHREIRHVRERCDDIEVAISRLVLVADHLVDIGMAQIQQTTMIERILEANVSATHHLTDIGMAQIRQIATVQNTLTGVVPSADLIASTPAGGQAETETDTTEKLSLGPVERQICDNFTRALHAFKS